MQKAIFLDIHSKQNCSEKIVQYIKIFMIFINVFILNIIDKHQVML